MKRLKKIFSVISVLLAVCCMFTALTISTSAGSGISFTIIYKSEMTVLKADLHDKENEIRYTIDGTDPTSGSALYKNPLGFEKAADVKIAEFTKKGELVGKIKTFEIRIKCSAPHINVYDNFDGTAKVKIKALNKNSVIHYTTDGSDPDESSPVLDGYFIVKTKKAVIKAVACREGWLTSKVASVKIGDFVTENSYEDYIRKAFELTNEERAKNGLDPLKLNEKLCAAAQIRAEELADCYENGHTRPDGTKWGTAIKEQGYVYRFAAENYAELYNKGVNSEFIIELWMSSDIHRSNILHEMGKDVGLGFVQRGDYCYWVQLFGQLK